MNSSDLYELAEDLLFAEDALLDAGVDNAIAWRVHNATMRVTGWANKLLASELEQSIAERKKLAEQQPAIETQEGAREPF